MAVTVLADIAVLRRQPDLFGRVGSNPTVWRVLDSIHSHIVIDIDGTQLDAHSDKQDATPTYKRGFGFYPILAYLDSTGEALAGMLRPGRAGSNNSADHLAVLDAALAQLPVTAEAQVTRRRSSSAPSCCQRVSRC